MAAGRRPESTGVNFRMAAKLKRRKVVKPRKPHAGFPVNFHNSGRFAKKIGGTLFYYGRWANVQGGQLVPVEDMAQAIVDAQATFDRFWSFDSTGRARPAGDAPTDDKGGGPLLLRDLCNAFLTSKVRKVNT